MYGPSRQTAAAADSSSAASSQNTPALDASLTTPTTAAAVAAASENLEILSLGRNVIKKISGLEEVGSTLRELWLSYNQIERLDGLQPCVKLQVLFMSNNKVKAWDEIEKLVITKTNTTSLTIFHLCLLPRAHSHRLIVWLFSVLILSSFF